MIAECSHPGAFWGAMMFVLSSPEDSTTPIITDAGRGCDSGRLHGTFPCCDTTDACAIAAIALAFTALICFF